MEGIGRFLETISPLIWPFFTVVLIIVIVFVFKSKISEILESIKNRRVSYKFGGQQITLDEADKQQQKTISEIMFELTELRDKIEGGTKFTSTRKNIFQEDEPIRNIRLLWVDDNPKNNFSHVQQLSSLNIPCDLAMSTLDGIKMFSEKKYSVVISDMGRQETDFNYTAGLDLLKAIRDINKDIPVIFFTTSENVKNYSSRAKELGATFITSSWTEVMGVLLKRFAKP